MKVFQRYWEAYGGLYEVVTSFYFLAAAALTGAAFPMWMAAGWWDAPLGILPNVLGFSLGGYAILLSFGDDRFKKLLNSTSKDGYSAFLRVNATFVHFIVVQAAAILFAVLCKAWAPAAGTAPATATKVVWFFGFHLFVYALVLAVAAAMAVFKLGDWSDRLMRKTQEVESAKAEADSTAKTRVTDDGAKASIEAASQEEAAAAQAAQAEADEVEEAGKIPPKRMRS